MATIIKMGGGPHPPVRLDPTQDIVNVHWPDQITHVAFSTNIVAVRMPFGGSPPEGIQVCGEAVLDSLDHPWGWDPWSLLEAWFEYPNNVRIRDMWTGNGKVWNFTGIPDDAPDKLPSLPGASNFDPFAYVLDSVVNVAGGANANSRRIAGSPLGSPTEIPVPGASGVFDQGLAFSVDFWLQPPAEGPLCVSDVFVDNRLQIRINGPGFPPRQAEPGFTLNLSGIVIVLEGKAYRAVAGHCPQRIVAGENLGGMIFVLCERSEADDPEEETS